jgi:hypothetical protein
MDRTDVKKTAGVIGLVLGALGWLGAKYEWFTTKVTDAMSVLSLVFGVVATAA